MGFQQGLSGLAAASKQLDVVGNNVANANTVGFKGSRAEFADLYAASLYGVSSTQAGIGTKTSAVAQQFTQGNITNTGNPLDMAVFGNGFFTVQRPGTNELVYTRNGQFKLDNQGFIVNNGYQLTGYTPDAPGVIKPLQVDAGSIGAKATTAIKLATNVTATATVPTVAFPGAVATAPDPKSYNHSTSVTVYDSLGTSHLVTMYYVKTTNPGEWQVYTRFDSNTMAAATPTTLTFDANGRLAGPVAPIAINVGTLPNGAAIGPDADLDGYPDNTLTVDVNGTTQFASAFAVNNLVTDGYTDGVLTGLVTTKEGKVQAKFSNGQVKDVGQIVLTNFRNPQGLAPQGDNIWTSTPEAGDAQVNTPGAGAVGVIQSAAVEDSNIDLTTELVNMITAQRFYQANAQTIKTQDQILQTLINLR